MAPDKEFVLERLFSVGDLRSCMPYKILYLGGKSYLYLQHTGKDLLHDIGKPGSNLMGVDQQHII